MAAVELLSLGNDSPSGLVPHSGNMHDFLLALALLGYSGWLLGLILISSLLVILMVLLLLLRKLPLVLVLMLTLGLGTLLELLG